MPYKSFKYKIKKIKKTLNTKNSYQLRRNLPFVGSRNKNKNKK